MLSVAVYKLQCPFGGLYFSSSSQVASYDCGHCGGLFVYNRSCDFYEHFQARHVECLSCGLIFRAPIRDGFSFACECGALHHTQNGVNGLYSLNRSTFKLNLLRRGGSNSGRLRPLILVHGYLSDSIKNDQDYYSGWIDFISPLNWEGPVYGLSWNSLGIDSLLFSVLVKSVWPISIIKKVPCLSFPMTALSSYGAAVKHWSEAKINANSVANNLFATLNSFFTPGDVNVSYSFLSHSLGAQVVLDFLRSFSVSTKCTIEHLVFCGAACELDYDWDSVLSTVTGSVVNFYNSKDWVLSQVYSLAENKIPLGLRSIPFVSSRVINFDCNDCSHSSGMYMTYIQNILQAS